MIKQRLRDSGSALQKGPELKWPAFGWVTIGTLLSLGIELVLPILCPVDNATISVDMKTGGGHIIQVYVNDVMKPPFEQPIIPGERHRYVFNGILDDIDQLRLDPTDAAAVDVVIYSLEIRDAKGLLYRYDGTGLAKWTRYHARVLDSRDEAFHFISTDGDPIMVVADKHALRRTVPLALSKIFAAFKNADLMHDFIAPALLIIMLACSLSDRERRLHLPLTMMVVVSSFLLMSATIRSVHTMDPVSTAVGHSSFVGISTRAGELATVTAVLGALILAIIARALHIFIKGRRGATEVEETADEDIGHRRLSKQKYAVFALVIAFIALAFYPRIYIASEYLLTAPKIFAGWDADLATYWSYLGFKGYLPYRDFWYPYAGRYIFSFPLPFGPALYWCYQIALYFGLFFTLYKTLGERFWRAFIATAVAMIAELTGTGFMNGDRYLLSITLFLSYVALNRTEKCITLELIVFWLMCGISFFFEPAQTVYGGAAIAVIVGLDILQRRPGSWNAWTNRLLREFAVPIAAIAMMLLWFGLNGQLSGMATLFLRAGDSAAYSSIPSDVSWLKHLQSGNLTSRLFTYEVTILLGPSIFVGIGLYERLKTSRQSKRYGDVLLGTGILFLIVLQKHMIRPMPTTLLIYVTLALFVYSSAWLGRRNIPHDLVSGLVLGITTYTFFHSGGIREILSRVADAPKHVLEDILCIVGNRELLEKANRALYSKARFVDFKDEQAVVSRIRSLVPETQNPMVFVLTDDPVIYIFTGQPPVFHANIYNASPIYEQQRVVKWLVSGKPQFVLLDPNSLTFDAVPDVVRIPLILAAVIENYVPSEKVGRFEVLRRRGLSDEVAMAYWRERLGFSSNFGHLLTQSMNGPQTLCKSKNDTSCTDWLEIRLRSSNTQAKSVEIPFEIQGQLYSIVFDVTSGKSDYYLPLDRFWPWAVAERQRAKPRIAGERLANGVEARIISRASSSPVLY